MLPPHLAGDAAADLGATLVDAEAYEAHRIALGVPRGGLDFIYADTFPHEADMDQLNGVDFEKGCYVGQEVVSRVEHRASARSRVVPIAYDEFAPSAGLPITAGDKQVGTLGSTAKGRGLALVAPRPNRGCACRRHAAGGGRHRPSRREAGLGEFRLAGRGEGRDMSKAVLHPDGLARCPWPKQDPLYVAYHDEEWGVPEYDDRALYEKLILDGFQAGLSWITILRKRDNFRRAFDEFAPEKIARYPKRKIESLMKDAGIVRNRAKIEGAVSSARAWLADHGEAARDFPICCGTISTASRSSIISGPPSRSRPRPSSRKKCRRNSSRADSNSSGRPSSTPSCRRSAWSTIISSPAIATRACAKLASASDDAQEPAPTSRNPRPRAWQRMLSGRRLDLLDPSPLDVEVEDIAHGLARVARWNGQTKGAHIFSVAQHALLVEALARAKVPRLDRSGRLAVLLHDAPEYVDRRHDLAVQGGDRRQLQGGGEAAARRHPSALRPAGKAAGRPAKP